MTTPAPQPPPAASGPDREDQAQQAGAAVGAAMQAAEAAILASVAAAVLALVAGSLTVQMAKRKIRVAISSALGAAMRKAGPVIAALPPSAQAPIRQAVLNAQSSAMQSAMQAIGAATGKPVPGSTRPSGGSSGKAPGPDASQLAMQQLREAKGSKGGPFRDVADAHQAAVKGAMAEKMSRLKQAQKVMDDLASQGITGFTDKAGRQWSLSSYAEMATRTAQSRLILQNQLKLMGPAGVTLVIVDEPSMEAPCPKCVLPGTVVEGPAPEWRIRTEYVGEIVRITTASGKDLSGTPDHAVLTPQGWRRLEELQPGDQVISNTGEQFACPPAALDVGVVMPDEVQVPALIEDAGKSRAPLLLARPPRRDLDTDIPYREVQVVWPDGLLLGEGNPALAEPLRDLDLVLGVGLPQQFLGGGGTLAPLKGMGSAAGRIVGGVEHGGPLFGSSTGPADAHGSGLLLVEDVRVHGLDSAPDAGPLRPGLDAVAAQIRADNRAGDPEDRPELLEGLTGDIAAAQFDRLGVSELARPDAVRDRGLTVFSEDGDSPRVADMEGGHELLQRLAGTVAADEVLTVDVRNYSGHVWDLQTSPSWYLTNGIVTHNCRPWVGKVLSLTPFTAGSSSTITDASGTTRTEQIAGTLAEAVAAGLLHPQCEHDLVPWHDGSGLVATAGGAQRGYVVGGKPVTRQLPNGSPEDYVNRQKLRGHERSVRRALMRVSAALTPQAKRAARTHLAASRAALEAHVAATGATRLPGREKAFRSGAKAHTGQPYQAR